MKNSNSSRSSNIVISGCLCFLAVVCAQKKKKKERRSFIQVQMTKENNRYNKSNLHVSMESTNKNGKKEHYTNLFFHI